MSLCGRECAPVYEDLFIINFTVYAMPYDDKMQFMALCMYELFGLTWVSIPESGTKIL